MSGDDSFQKNIGADGGGFSRQSDEVEAAAAVAAEDQRLWNRQQSMVSTSDDNGDGMSSRGGSSERGVSLERMEYLRQATLVHRTSEKVGCVGLVLLLP
jgi:hypothetical protein